MSKKFLFICFLLGMFMFVPAGAHAASDDGSPATAITGDVNGDGVLDVTDVMVLANYISNPSAQTLNTDVADVNGDGTVDSSDIDALINKVLGIVTKYYWYVGQTDPSTMTEISPIVSDTSSEGWRLIGTTTSGFTYNFVNNPFTLSSTKVKYYLSLPAGLKIYASDGNSDVTDTYFDKGTSKIDGYNVYIYAGKVKEINSIIIK